MFNLTQAFQIDLGGHTSSFISGSTLRCYGRAGVLSACELSSEAQRAAIQQAVMDFTPAFMSSLAAGKRKRDLGEGEICEGMVEIENVECRSAG